MWAIDFLKASFGLTLSVNIRSALSFCSDPSGLYLDPIAMGYPFCRKILQNYIRNFIFKITKTFHFMH